MLSDLSPGKPNSFLRRVSALVRREPDVRIKVVSFGRLGSELNGAFSGDQRHHEAVTRKLVELHGFTDEEASTVLDAVRLERVSETELRETVFDVLREACTGIDSEPAFDLLTAWLFICAEERRHLTRHDVTERLGAIGSFLAARAAHHAEWFTSIVPIEDRILGDGELENLADAFYKGVAARYEHILADLDVPRPDKILEIATGFDQHRIVVIHGASGQGKSTLAYRYLHDIFPDLARFQVRRVQDAVHALRIGTALAGYANAIGSPMAIFLDVNPRDTEWPELVAQLAAHDSLRILVSVREEDWRRAGIADYQIEVAEIALDFDRVEAESVYRSLTERLTSRVFIDFEDAWSAFREAGPLLEFVYLVTQGQSLRDRLKQQVDRLEDEAEESEAAAATLRLLRLVSVASAYEGRLHFALLADRLGLQTPRRIVELLEEEYLVRVTEDRSLLDGIHPIRSEILTDLLTDPVVAPWAVGAAECLNLIDEQDIGAFLLYAFSRRREALNVLLDAVQTCQPQRWTGIAGVVRALLWLGEQNYADSNRAVFDEARLDSGSGWSAVLDIDLAGIAPDLAKSIKDMIGNIKGQERRQEIEALQAKLGDKSRWSELAVGWMRRRIQAPTLPTSSDDWRAAAAVILWAGWLEVDWPVQQWLPVDVLTEAVQSLPLATAADLVASLQYGYGEGFVEWMSSNWSQLGDRFRRETMTPILVDDGRTLTARFVVDPESLNAPAAVGRLPVLDPNNQLHNEAIARIDLLRRLLPDRDSYGAQGYGHREWDIASTFDDTSKTGVLRTKLPLRNLVSVNSTLRGIVEWPWRPRDWQDFAQQLVELREDAVRCLEDLAKALPSYLASPHAAKLLGGPISNEAWYRPWRVFREPPFLPSGVVDEWGFVDEDLVLPAAKEQRVSGPGLLARSIALERYRPLLKAMRDYARPLENFLRQAPDVMAANQTVRKRSKSHQASMSSSTATPNGAPTRLSVSNLCDAWKALPLLQVECRLLSHYIGEQQLADLEQREASLYERVWPLWYAYAMEPEKVLRNPSSNTPKRIPSLHRQMTEKVREELVAAGAPGLQFHAIEKTILWEDERALWLTIDGTDAITVYGSLEIVLQAVRQAIGRVEASEFRRYVLDLHWPSVVVVPLVRGRSLVGAAWKFRTSNLLEVISLDALGFWSLVQQPIPKPALKELDIAAWDEPRLELGLRLVEATSEMWILAAHLRDLEAMPEGDELATELFHKHRTRVSERLNRSLQELVNAQNDMQNATTVYSASSEFVEKSRERLTLLAEVLEALRASSFPFEDFSGTAELDQQTVNAWAERLKNDGLNYANIAHLAWASVVLGDQENQESVAA